MFLELKPHMLSSKNISSFFLEENSLKKKERIGNPIPKKDNSLLIPKFENNLFWCFYIILYGLSKYFSLSHNFKEEQNEKIKFITFIRDNKDKMKRGKFKRVKTENDILYSKKLSMSSFLCLCYLYEINIVILDNNKFIENIMNDNKKIIFIKKIDNNYGIYDTKKTIDYFREKYLRIEDISKPIKALSNYKAKDLRKICHKLNINIYNNKNKIMTMKTLYQLIIEKI